MKMLSLAGLASLATLGAQAQAPGTFPPVGTFESLVVTANRAAQPAATLRDTVVITREDLEAAGNLSLGEVLERRAGVQLRATGGAGQPQGLFIRGAGTSQTLVLVDGLRVSSATIGSTSIESIPVDMIERIEVVKGPLSSLYGSEAIGGVVQVFTRGRSVPHLFGALAYGTDQDLRASAGVAATEDNTAFSLSMGGRKVDAPSATNARAFCHDADRDPHDEAFVNLHASHRLWQDELLALDAFATRNRTEFDGCGSGDRNDHTLFGAKFTSSRAFTGYWNSRFSIGHGRDELEIRGAFPGRFETRQDQATWINDFRTPAGSLLAGAEFVRQRISTDESQGAFARTKRDTTALFAGMNEAWTTPQWGTQRIEASVRAEDDESFGRRNTGSVSYGFEWPQLGRLSGTYGRGFRAPTFFDLYGPSSDFYQPNPSLSPERSESMELALRAPSNSRVQWRLTAFDNRIDDLITFVFPTVMNVKRARIKGLEGALEATWLDIRWRATFTAQDPRDDETGKRLPGRAERYGSLEASRSFGPWTVAGTVLAVGDRFDSTTEDPAQRMPSYALLDARVRYRFAKLWSVELSATNLTDKRYENAVGYDAPRRSILLSVRFDAF
jgi:vitamin B12 transporter